MKITRMSQSNRMNFMTPNSSKITQMTNATHEISSVVPAKTSLFSRARQSWLTIVISLIAIGGILGTVCVAVLSFATFRQTALSTMTTISTTSTSTTTAISCFTISSPRPSNVWLLVANMSVPRVYHTSTLISQDNSVLIAGGLSGSPLSSVDKYIPSTGCFQSMRNMPRTRYMHTADQLPSFSNYVVIAGGYGATGVIGFADLYHPITGDILTIPLTLPRYRHTSGVLSSSQIVLIGGYTTGSVLVNSSDMLDTASNFSFAPGSDAMTEPRIYHTATVLGNNSDVVLIAAGYSGTAYLGTGLLYDGSSNSFISLGSASTITPVRGFHTATYLPPPINKVLIAGGNNGAAYGTLVLFDIASLTFTTLANNLLASRYYHTATLLPTGKILIAGGYSVGSLRTCELIDPSNNYIVTSASSLNANRYFHTATLIPDNNNGNVLICGGYDVYTAVINSCELYFV